LEGGGAGDEESVDTMELIGSDAARAIELKDTGSSKRRKLNNFMAAGQGRAAGAGAAGGSAAGRDVVVIDDDDDDDNDRELEGGELRRRVNELFQQLARLIENSGLEYSEMEMVERAERERMARELSGLLGVSEDLLMSRIMLVSGGGDTNTCL
jgi:hypothetical protein